MSAMAIFEVAILGMVIFGNGTALQVFCPTSQNERRSIALATRHFAGRQWNFPGMVALKALNSKFRKVSPVEPIKAPRLEA